LLERRQFVSVKAVTGKIGNVFYGWWVVAAGSFLYALGIGSVFYGFNTFFTPMVNEFGWSRAATSGAFSLSRLEGGVFGPIVGWLIDRLGSRKIAIFGMVLAAVGFVALPLVNTNVITLYIIFGLVLSLGYTMGPALATTAAAAKWFIKKRSLALSFIAVGGGVGGAVIVPLLAWLITQYGWRWAAVIIGLGILVTGVPVALVIRNTPEEKGLLPDGQKAVSIEEAASTGIDRARSDKLAVSTASGLEEPDFTVKEALKTSNFWFYTLAMLLRAAILGGIVVHEIPYLVDMGIEYEAAADVLGTMILISIPGRLILGWIGDRIDKRYLLLASNLLQGIGIWILINASSLGMVYLFVIIYGFGYGGAIPLSSALRADLFGRKIFATIGGIVTTITTISTVAAPVLAGYLYDVSHSYHVAFYAFMIMISLSGFAFLLVRRPKLKPVTIAAR
jgi:MFS family permease